MLRVLEAYLGSLVKNGSLSVESPGRVTRLGDGTGPDLAIRFADRGVPLALLRDPVLRFGELYMDGRIEVTRGSLFEVVSLFTQAMAAAGSSDLIRLFDRIRQRLSALKLPQGLGHARRNVQHHYDLDGRLYRLFLDSDLQYSCAYFADGEGNLDAAQLAKKRHIAAKLAIAPGHRVLDIGCGWGGMALYLAQYTGAEVRGITLSAEQFAVARERAVAAGLADRTAFTLEDYRETDDRFDRIVSVGMLEHVGRKGFFAFFRRLADLMTEDGVALVHTIGLSGSPAPAHPWVEKYIFPGGYVPALSELLPAIEAAGLVVTDIEVLRLHYAETIRAWRENFRRRRAEACALYDERFCRMWDLYLCGAECAFRYEGEVNFQIQLTRRIGTLPLTRGYMAEREEDLRRFDSAGAELRIAGE